MNINSAMFSVDAAELVVSRANDSNVNWRVLDLHISAKEPSIGNKIFVFSLSRLPLCFLMFV